MSAQHTPGPWHVKSHASIPGVVVGGIAREYKNGVAQDQLFMVCSVQPDNGGDQAQAANARLIAAAPDLLVQLRAVTAELESQIARSLPPSKAHIAAWSPHVIDARAAIAKAIGAAS